MIDTIPLWIHIVAAAAWVGPQFFMFVATVPALRVIDDPELRRRVLRVSATRFGWLAWAAMVVLVLSGLSNVFDHEDESAISVLNFDWRYSWVFFAKMGLVALTIALTALHSFVVGPRQMRLAEESAADSPEGERLRRASIALSALNLLASVAVLYAAALLANDRFSIQPM